MIRGSAFAALSMMLAGSSVAVLGTLRDYPVFAGQALRFGLAAVLLHLLVRRVGPPGPAPRLTPAQGLRVLVLAGFGMVGFNVAATAAEHHTDPAFVGVVVGTAPLVVGVLTPLFARARPSGRVVAAGLLVAAGVAAAQGLGAPAGGPGLALAVVALAAEVVFALVAAPLVAPLGALRVSAYACAAAVPICLAGAVATGAYVLPTPGQVAAVVWLGAVATAVAYVLWFTALDAIGAEQAVLFSGLVPLSAVATTAVLGTGAPGAGHVVGAVAVVAGLVVGTVSRRPAGPPARLRGRAAPDGEGGVAWVSDSVPPSSTAPISTP
ncbi:DMT family transporter [Streptomyces sp. KE1]|uniref:DMT family transporter n=1 Tax=Streptomyces sp. KE1 TaxID=1638939 RepID=UPI00063E8D96|nr:DMT family transporter [Streptomyces sp. KE1]KLJ01215.1 membrane protein [Streptomyces sp. KE1]